MTSTPKNGPKLEKQAIWRDPSSNGFYVWGGTVAYSDTPPAKELWHFEVDGNRGGTWTQATPASVVAFSKLTRTTEASFTQRFGQYGTLIRGSAQFVPFGSSGILLFLGGGQAPVSFPNGTLTAMDFNKVTLYNPSTDKWHTQQTTGSRPATRGKFCVVGASSTNSTYEIALLSFLYGGMSTATGSVSGDVYVLSLPGFVFFKAAGSSAIRADHACVVEGEGGPAPTNSTSDPSPTEQSNAGSATSTPQGSKPSNPPIGTIVGAVVGGVVGLVLVICLVVFFLRRKRYQAAPQQETGGTPPEYEKPGSAQYGYNGPAGINALHEGYTDHFNPVELPAEHGAAELSSTHGRYELGQTVARPS
ncbi:hypothetical protein BDP67DRAFT_616479 [Colletotrichum lupini]|nr:hypothetical protein BDP67DRAFT_616479 [Colletotrichum lupini]